MLVSIVRWQHQAHFPAAFWRQASLALADVVHISRHASVPERNHLSSLAAEQTVRRKCSTKRFPPIRIGPGVAQKCWLGGGRFCV